MNAISSVTPKRVKLIPMLTTDKDGELVATVHAIRRALKSAGCELHDLALVFERAGLPAIVEQPELPHWQDLARDCLRRGAHRLSGAELDFARSMATWPSKPTSRQWRWLTAIAMSLGIEVAS